ncbi:hypothetical protein [Frigoribacterium sp. RIT-PI-h]|uniref:hypothetical protein n=1 Tax=Frigoribacterium sp. RIT-PI-h TaxID=1690245 RepID=UPI00128F2CAE|nr:hypothetical protein [Frigoribacterium sp. RIT-PI-h]
MKAVPIDPRDQTSQLDDPTYRVYFWSADGAAKEEWELSEADLGEVLDWVATSSGGRRHSLWAVTSTMINVTLIRLEGIDLDADAEAWPAWAQEVRR